MKYNYGVFFLLLFGLSSCGLFNQENERTVVARYIDSELFGDVVSKSVPKNISPKDSLVFVKHFVNEWAREHAILEHAVFNLKDEELEIKELVESYKNSLIKQRFEQKYLREKLDTNITELQSKEYYSKNRKIFVLKESIIRLKYIRFSKLVSNMEEVKEHFEIDDEFSQDWLIDFSHQFAKRQFFNDSIWLKLNDFVEELPIQDFQKNILLNKNKIFVFEDDKDYYMLKIVDYKIKNQIPPLNYVKAQVHRLILHQRKKELLEELENSLFDRALKEGKFEFY
jgi:hypothetical protein